MDFLFDLIFCDKASEIPSLENIALIFKDTCNYICCNVPDEQIDIDFHLEVLDKIIEYIRDVCFNQPSSLRISNSLESTLANSVALRLNLLDEKIKKGGAIFPEKKALKFEEIEKGFKERARVAIIRNAEDKDFEVFMRRVKPVLIANVEKIRSELRSLKFQCVLYAKFKQVEREKTEIKHFGTKNYRVFIRDDIVQAVESIRSVLATKIQEFEHAGSGWSLEELLHIKINIAKLNPMRAGCYIDLPKDIKAKRACVNVRNLDDDLCLIWSILAGLDKDKKKKIHPTHVII